MNTNNLIETLSRDTQPVRRLPGPTTIAVLMFGISLLPALVSSALMGMRSDFGLRLTDLRFWLITILLLAIILMGQGMVSTLAFPGRKVARWGTQMGGVLLVAIAGILLSQTPWFEETSTSHWLLELLICTSRASLVGLVPLVGSLRWLRRGATVHPRRSGALLGMVGGLLGAFALQWSCDFYEPAHILAAHLILPGVLLAFLGSWAGQRWLRW